MGFNHTSDALIDDIKRRTFMPISQITYSDEDVLDFADEETQVGIVPLLMSVREEYLVTYHDEIIDPNKNGYNIPRRAIVQKLSDVTVVNVSSDPVNPVEVSLPRISADVARTQINSYPGFYIKNNKVILQTAHTYTGQTLRQYYFLRPSKLVLSSEGSRITKVGPSPVPPTLTANQIEVSNIPVRFGTSTTFTQKVDIIRGTPGFDIVQMDIEATFNVNTLIVTFPSLTELPEGLESGDWICLAGETVVPQIPVEMVPILAQRAAIKILEGQGDVSNLQIAQAKLREAEKAILGLLSNRVEGEPQKIVNFYSPLRVFPWRRT